MNTHILSHDGGQGRMLAHCGPIHQHVYLNCLFHNYSTKNKMKISKKILVFTSSFFLCALLFVSCRHDPVGVDVQPQVCFQTDVLPVVQSNCGKSGCHSGSGQDSRLNLATTEGILRSVSPGQPLSSNLYTAIMDGNMPPSPNHPLSKDQRTAIYLWILQGADTTCVAN